MATLVDVEVADELEARADDWARPWADVAPGPSDLYDWPSLLVDCAVCGGTHHHGTDDDPRCGD